MEEFFNLLNKKKEYDLAETEYIKVIQEFYINMVEHVHVNFKRNKMYLTFETWDEIPPDMMLDFCNMFGYLAPTCEYKKLSDYVTLRFYKFIKILD